MEKTEGLEEVVKQFPALIYFNGYLPQNLNQKFISNIKTIQDSLERNELGKEYIIDQPKNLLGGIFTEIKNKCPETIQEEVSYPLKEINKKEDAEKLKEFFTRPQGKLKEAYETPIIVENILNKIPEISIQNNKLKKFSVSKGPFLRYSIKKSEFTQNGKYHEAERHLYPSDPHITTQEDFIQFPERQAHKSLADHFGPIKDEKLNIARKITSYKISYDSLTKDELHSPVPYQFIQGALTYDFLLNFEKDLEKYLKEEGLKINPTPFKENHQKSTNTKRFLESIAEFAEIIVERRYKTEQSDFFNKAVSLYQQAEELGKTEDMLSHFKNVEETYNTLVREFKESNDPIDNMNDFIPIETYLYDTRNKLKQLYNYNPPEFNYEFVKEGSDSSSWIFRNHLNNLFGGNEE